MQGKKLDKGRDKVAKAKDAVAAAEAGLAAGIADYNAFLAAHHGEVMPRILMSAQILDRRQRNLLESVLESIHRLQYVVVFACF